MKTIDDMQENIIPSAHQNDKEIFNYDNGKNGIRILFVGNSISLHAPKPEVGWTNNCGMAASDINHDYIHVLMNKIHQLDSDANFSICQVADLEREYDVPETLDRYRSAADFDPDIVIMFFGANVPQDKCDGNPEQVKLFADMYRRCRDVMQHGRAAVFHSQGFYIRPVLDEAKKAVCADCGDTWISLEHINKREDTHGMFNHPNDLGMQEIADTFYEAIEPALLKRLGKN